MGSTSGTKKYIDEEGNIRYTKFEYEIGTIICDGKRNLEIIDRFYNNKECKKFYICKCLVCDYEYKISAGNLSRGHGCSCCTGQTVVIGKNDIPSQPQSCWMIKYFQGGYEEAQQYTDGSGKKLYFKCPDCGRVKDKPMPICDLKKKKSISCRCGDGFEDFGINLYNSPIGRSLKSGKPYKGFIFKEIA